MYYILNAANLCVDAMPSETSPLVVVGSRSRLGVDIPVEELKQRRRYGEAGGIGRGKRKTKRIPRRW